MIEKLTNFINDNTFRYTIYEDKIHIINYTRIISLEDDRISFQNKNQKIVINGNKFTLVKLLDQEMLIKGSISKIEVSYE